MAEISNLQAPPLTDRPNGSIPVEQGQHLDALALMQQAARSNNQTLTEQMIATGSLHPVSLGLGDYVPTHDYYGDGPGDSTSSHDSDLKQQQVLLDIARLK